MSEFPEPEASRELVRPPQTDPDAARKVGAVIIPGEQTFGYAKVIEPDDEEPKPKDETGAPTERPNAEDLDEDDDIDVASAAAAAPSGGDDEGKKRKPTPKTPENMFGKSEGGDGFKRGVTE